VAFFRHSAVALLLPVLLAGCSVGEGQGELTANVTAAGCDVPQDYALEPSLFTGEVTGDQLNLRIQRGSDLEGHADGLIVHVRDVDEVKADRIGLPLRFRDDSDALVQAVLYLNESCPSGFPDDFRTRPYAFLAVDGTITFDSIYAPNLDAGDTLVEARLEDVRFEDREEPEDRHAVLNGFFSFFYQRGSPAQRFP
jgi:hypothetical protein